MTGPEHYRIAEDLVLAATRPSSINPEIRILREVVSADVIAVAHVHATLAAAAATALNVVIDGVMPRGDWEAWCEVAGTRAEAAVSP